MSENGYKPRIWRGPLNRALILENPHPTLDDYLRDQGIEPDRREENPRDEDELVSWLEEGQHNFIFKRSRVPVTERVVQASDSLAAVMLCCIGDDSVDKQACARAGVMVMNDPISNGRSVVEMVLGELICMSRRIFEAAHYTNRSEWTKSGEERYEIRDKTLGIVGLGNIGKQVAQVADALGMEMAFYDTREVAQEVGTTLGWSRAKTLEELFAQSHIVTVHVSATDYRGRSNEGLITRDALMALGRDVDVPGPRLFLNASRGFILEPDDLIEAVTDGPIQYAMVDVFPEEPARTGDLWTNPFAEIEEIYATPHIGAATQEAQPRIARRMATTTQLFNNFGYMRDCVYSPRHPIGIPEADRTSYVLSVVHSDRRGTKRCIDEAIYDAGLSNISSVHSDFQDYGVAYDLNALDGPMDDDEIDKLIEEASRYTGEEDTIRSVRMIHISEAER